MLVVRGAMVVVGAGMLPLSALAALKGGEHVALTGVLAGVALILLATWGWSPSIWTVVGGALTAATFILLGNTKWLVVGLLVFGGVLALVILFNVVSSLLVARRMSTMELERVGADEAVMPESRELVSQLEAEGFRCAGGIRWKVPLRGKVLTTTVLAGPASDRFTTVTPGLWEVTSTFGAREVTTTSLGILAPPPWVLRQVVGTGSAELLGAHQSALELLARRGLVPDRVDDDEEVVDAALAVERRACRFIAGAPAWKVVYPGFRTRRPDPVLDGEERSRRRVDAWLQFQPEQA